MEEAAEPACFACTVRPSFRAGREDWEAATIRDAREAPAGWRSNVTDAQIAEGILKGLSGSRSSQCDNEDAGSFPTTVLYSLPVLESHEEVLDMQNSKCREDGRSY